MVEDVRGRPPEQAAGRGRLVEQTEDLADSVLQLAQSRAAATLVAIDGTGGSGKTSAASTSIPVTNGSGAGSTRRPDSVSGWPRSPTDGSPSES